MALLEKAVAASGEAATASNRFFWAKLRPAQIQAHLSCL
jgi:hypothetical protein